MFSVASRWLSPIQLLDRWPNITYLKTLQLNWAEVLDALAYVSGTQRENWRKGICLYTDADGQAQAARVEPEGG